MNMTKMALEGITSAELYPDGQMRSCKLNRRNIIPTGHGELIPHFSPPGIRDKELKSVSFYESGVIRSVALDRQTDLLTPMGVCPAELVTFYENGGLESIFPLNGQIGFGWSEEEERALAEEMSFDFPFGGFKAKIIGLRFYESGNLRSLILWPGEVIELSTPAGCIPVRIGFRLHENGSLASVEPALPATVISPAGRVKAYDAAALGVDADINSLRFGEEGGVTGLSTSGDIIVRNRGTGRRSRISQTVKYTMNDRTVMNPLRLAFSGDKAAVSNGELAEEYIISDCDFLFMPDFDLSLSNCGGSCDGCDGCG